MVKSLVPETEWTVLVVHDGMRYSLKLNGIPRSCRHCSCEENGRHVGGSSKICHVATGTVVSLNYSSDGRALPCLADPQQGVGLLLVQRVAVGDYASVREPVTVPRPEQDAD